MRQLTQVFLFDVRMSFKSFMGAYMLVVPLVILLVLRFFLPSVQNASATVAVVTEGEHAVEAALVEELDVYFDVATYETVDAMEDRLRGTGSAEGLYREPGSGQYVSVLERNIQANTAFSNAARTVRQYTYQTRYPDAPRATEFTAMVPDALSNRAENPPVATMGGAIFIAFIGMLSSFLIGLSVINDKEYGTDRALQVSPVSKPDYYIGKSLLPLMVMLLYPAIAVFVLGLAGTNLLQLYAVMVVSFSITLFLGLVVGALGKNENEAIGLVKSIGMVVMLGILGGTLLPDNWQWIVYWVPVYWVFDIAQEIFTVSADWGTVGWKSAVIVGTCGLYFLALRKRIAAGLSYG